jgi:hypothetical protein
VGYDARRLHAVYEYFKAIGVDVVMVVPQEFQNSVFCCHLLGEIEREHVIDYVDRDIDDE